MKEIEAKFYPVNPEELRSKLLEIGAEKTQERTKYYSTIYHLPEDEERQKWVRVRDEAGKINMTYKDDSNNSLSGTIEYGLEINDSEIAHQFLLALGLTKTRYQEKDREIWRHDGVEIVIDWWPWLEPLCEVGADSEAKVINTCRNLDLNLKGAFYGGTGRI